MLSALLCDLVEAGVYEWPIAAGWMPAEAGSDFGGGFDRLGLIWVGGVDVGQWREWVGCVALRCVA